MTSRRLARAMIRPMRSPATTPPTTPQPISSSSSVPALRPPEISDSTSAAATAAKSSGTQIPSLSPLSTLRPWRMRAGSRGSVTTACPSAASVGASTTARITASSTVSSPKTAAAAIAPTRIVSARPIPSSRTGTSNVRRNTPRSMREASVNSTRARVASARRRTVESELARSIPPSTSGPARSPNATNNIAGVIGVPARRPETAATPMRASATSASAHSIEFQLPAAATASLHLGTSASSASAFGAGVGAAALAAAGTALAAARPPRRTRRRRPPTRPRPPSVRAGPARPRRSAISAADPPPAGERTDPCAAPEARPAKRSPSLWATIGVAVIAVVSLAALRPGGGPLDLGDVRLDLLDVGLELLLLELLCSLHRPLDLRAHVGDRDDDEAGRALVELLAELLEVVAAQPRGGVTGHGAEDRATGRRAREQAASDGGEGEQRDDQPGRQPHAAAEHATNARRGLVLLDDLGLALVRALDDRGVVGVDQPGLLVEVADELVVGLGVVDRVVDPNDHQQRVNRHGTPLHLGCGRSIVARPRVTVPHPEG